MRRTYLATFAAIALLGWALTADAGGQKSSTSASTDSSVMAQATSSPGTAGASVSASPDTTTSGAAGASPSMSPGAASGATTTSSPK